MEYVHAIAPLNLLAVAASTVAMLVASGLWLSPFLFGRAWARLSGIRPGDIRPADARRNFITSLVTAIIASALLGLSAQHAGNNKIMLFSGVGFIWLFIMLEQLNATIWQRQPIALFLLQTLRSLAALMAGAAIFYLWS